jgi:hypothetical protein
MSVTSLYRLAAKIPAILYIVPDNYADSSVNLSITVYSNANFEQTERKTLFGSYLVLCSVTTASLSWALEDFVRILAPGLYDCRWPLWSGLTPSTQGKCAAQNHRALPAAPPAPG